VRLKTNREIAKRNAGTPGEIHRIAKHTGTSLGDFAIHLNPSVSPK
jgi:DNA-binding transcriptional regulator YiaG